MRLTRGLQRLTTRKIRTPQPQNPQPQTLNRLWDSRCCSQVVNPAISNNPTIFEYRKRG